MPAVAARGLAGFRSSSRRVAWFATRSAVRARRGWRQVQGRRGHAQQREQADGGDPVALPGPDDPAREPARPGQLIARAPPYPEGLPGGDQVRHRRKRQQLGKGKTAGS